MSFSSTLSLPTDSLLIAGLRFSTDLPVWFVIGGSILAGVVVMALYLRETSAIGSPWSWVLPGMRATAVVLACLLLAGPVWHRRQVIGNPARIVWAVDRSLSMSETDSQSGATGDRMRRATDLLFGSQANEGWIEQLRETHLMDVVLFDDAAQLAWSSDESSELPAVAPETPQNGDGERVDLRAGFRDETRALFDAAEGTVTDLSAPLRSVVAVGRLGADGSGETNGEETSRALVLFSDGRDSAGRSGAGELAVQLADAGWVVHTVGMGSLEEAADVGVVDVDAPERVADDGRLAGRVWVKHFGIGQQGVRVDIRSGEQIVWSETVELEGDGKTPVEFDFPVESLMKQAASSDVRGVDRESVVLSLAAEVSFAGGSSAGDVAVDGVSSGNAKSANDSMAFRIAAASRDRRLLILDGSARWEIRYLKNLFSRDPAWAVDTILFGRGTDMPTVYRGEEPGELPESARGWSRYDAVVLGEIPADQWTSEDAERLTEFVAGGGGLVVIDGRYERVRELSAVEAMASLIPVSFDIENENENNGPFAKIVSVVPTDAGRTHPVMLLDVGASGGSDGGDSSDSGELWKRLPAPSSINIVRSQPDAEVWASGLDEQGNETPWLVTRMFGGGRVFYLASDQTWRWRYKIESRLHSRFWNQLMTAAMQPPYAVQDDFVAIGTDKIDYRVGQSATIRARLLGGGLLEGEDGTDPSGAFGSNPPRTVDALLLRDDQVIATLPMRLDDARRRTYIGQTDALPEGEYRVRVRASGFDAGALKASTPIWVVPPRRGELDRVSLDEAALQRIANSGAGGYWHESSADEVLANLKPLSGGRIVESDTLLWQSWWVFCIIITLLGLEWWLRKRVGLI